MSLINGDKSRAGRLRKSKAQQRAKNRLLAAPPAAASAAAAKPALAVKK